MATFRKLVNQDYVKVCTDATFKQCFGKWTIAPIGVLVKNYSQATHSRGGGVSSVTKGWATHMVPLLWVVASGELSEGYSLGIRSLTSSLQRIAAIDLRERARQLHADLTQTAENARTQWLPASIRAADFWHTLEALTAMLLSELKQKDAQGGLKYFHEILSWVHMTRTGANLCLTWWLQASNDSPEHPSARTPG